MPKSIKGLFSEFGILLFLYTLDVGTDFAVYSEAQMSRDRYKKILRSPLYNSNATKGYLFCNHGAWDKRDYQDKVDIYGRVVDVYLFFLFVSGVIFIGYVIAYAWFLIQATRVEYFLEDNKERLISIKFWFGFILSFALDIPCACLAVDLYSERAGATGLLCWECAQDVKCDDKRVLKKRLYIILACLGFNFLGLIIISLWKGITTFYRWSKTDKVDCWHIRGCVSMFVGCYYSIVMITPALGVLKYKFFIQPSQKDNVFSEFADSMFMIGLLGWIVFLVVGCCFPLLRMIRIGPSAGQDRKNGDWC